MLEVKNINKSFFGNPALVDVSFSVEDGEIISFVGQNGAGKSTLMKVLSGAITADSGEIVINGEKVVIRDPMDSEKHGISIVYQELSNMPHLTVSANIVSGHEKMKGVWLDKKEESAVAREYLKRLGEEIDPDMLMSKLSISQQQICEIAKAISKNPKIVILDEPTTALTMQEREKLFEVMRKMKKEGLIILFITHYLEDVLELSDKCLVLKDGKTIYSGNMEGLNQEKLVNMMVGQKVENFYPLRNKVEIGEVALELRDFGDDRARCSFRLHYGEIVGLSGLIGAGRTEIAKMIFGEEKAKYGELLLDSKTVTINSPQEAITRGIAYISEDRKKEGLCTKLTIGHNLSLPSMVARRKDLFKGSGLIHNKNESKKNQEMIERLQIKCTGEEQMVYNLSGGNQQKISISKWIETNAKIYIFDEPTKGIDINAKISVYHAMNELAESGAAVLLISSYNPELLELCDRILTMSRGKMTVEFSKDKDKFTEKDLMLAQQIL